MKPYIPIDCHFHDRLEEAIVLRREVELIYLDRQQQEILTYTRIQNTTTEGDEEFILLSDGNKIRMDRIVSLDGNMLPRRTS